MGRNVVTVTVTASDNVTTRDYTVSVNRGSDAPFGWKAEDDFDTLKAAGNVEARGIWSDGTTLWVGDDKVRKEKLYAYTLASRQRNSDQDFDTLRDAGNRSIRGIWSDGTTMWVADYNSERIFAYARTTSSGTKTETSSTWWIGSPGGPGASGPTARPCGSRTPCLTDLRLRAGRPEAGRRQGHQPRAGGRERSVR